MLTIWPTHSSSNVFLLGRHSGRAVLQQGRRLGRFEVARRRMVGGTNRDGATRSWNDRAGAQQLPATVLNFF